MQENIPNPSKQNINSSARRKHSVGCSYILFQQSLWAIIFDNLVDEAIHQIKYSWKNKNGHVYCFIYSTEKENMVKLGNLHRNIIFIHICNILTKLFCVCACFNDLREFIFKPLDLTIILK